MSILLNIFTKYLQKYYRHLSSARNKSRPYNYNPLKALLPTHGSTLISTGFSAKKADKASRKNNSINISKDKQSSQKRLGSPTPWKNPTQVLEYIPPANSKIHIPAEHPQIHELGDNGRLLCVTQELHNTMSSKTEPMVSMYYIFVHIVF